MKDKSRGRKPADGKASTLIMARQLEKWFSTAARDLPWRCADSNENVRAYHVMVSEFMLQQTQVSRVIEKFIRFVTRFPTVGDLAAASEQEVLAQWQGLGYYRRALHLHRAARAIVDNFSGKVPRTVERLGTLPGIGLYTAGAIASIAFDERVPIVDGNVTRVALRVLGDASDPKAPKTIQKIWRWADSMVQAAQKPSVLNQALMELGAMTCTPRSPLCEECPLSRHCQSLKSNSVHRIPRPQKSRQPVPVEATAYFVRRSSDGAILLQQRPPNGMWASMWQLPTVESSSQTEAKSALDNKRRPYSHSQSLIGSYTHKTTHRLIRYRLNSMTPDCKTIAALFDRDSLTWVLDRDMASRPMSNAQVRLLRMAKAKENTSASARRNAHRNT